MKGRQSQGRGYTHGVVQICIREAARARGKESASAGEAPLRTSHGRYTFGTHTHARTSRKRDDRLRHCQYPLFIPIRGPLWRKISEGALAHPSGRHTRRHRECRRHLERLMHSTPHAHRLFLFFISNFFSLFLRPPVVSSSGFLAFFFRYSVMVHREDDTPSLAPLNTSRSALKSSATLRPPDQNAGALCSRAQARLFQLLEDR